MTLACLDPISIRTTPISQAEMARIQRAFADEGFVILKGVIPPAAVAGARETMKRLSDERLARFLVERKITDLHADLPFEKRLIAVAQECAEAVPNFFREELHVPGMHPFLLNPALVDIAERFLGSEVRIYPNYMARPKLPDDQRMLICWHQDAAYTDNFKVTGAAATTDLRTVNLWSPLVPARRANGCMQFIPASHKLGLVPYHQFQDIHLKIDDSALAPVLDHAVDIELDPGDVVMFDNLLFHQGLPNTSDTIRWSVDWRFQDATQPTLRPQHGQLVRSARDPGAAVRDAGDWGRRVFG
ncbi:MAG: phytanoyl-CoA dioxygenase family protein [Planctomycetes bacterium]|nr:phytanoyl-CoA dioxygenase family protein [Planctomycetota bacterium]